MSQDGMNGGSRRQRLTLVARSGRRRRGVRFGEIFEHEIAKLDFVDIVGDVRSRDDPNYR